MAVSAVAMRIVGVEKGRGISTDERIAATAGDDIVWVSFDGGNYEIRFEDSVGSPFNDKGDKENVGVGKSKKVHKGAKKIAYKYSVYTDGVETHDPEVVIV